MSGSTSPRNGPATARGGKRPGSPREVRFRARGMSWPWRCWTKPRPAAAARLGRRRRRNGPLLMVPRAVAVAWASAICWPCRRTRRCGTCSPRPGRTRAGAVGVRARPSCVWTTGAPGVAEGAWQTVEVPGGGEGPGAGAGRVDAGAARTEGRASDVAGGPGGLPGAARRRHMEARLPAVQRVADDPLGGVRASGCSRRSTGSRSALQRAKGEAWVWRTTRSAPGGAASPPGPGAGGGVVPDDGNTPREKNGRRR